MPLQLFTSSNQQTTLKFYTDIISSSIFTNQQISFLASYDERQLTDYGMVVCGESIVKDIIGKVVKGDANKLNEIKSIVSEEINNILQQQPQQQQQQHKLSLISAISQSIFNRLEQIKAQYLLNAVSLGSLHLIDVNWKITKTISSQARSFVGQKLPYLFTLILYIKGSNSGQQQINSSNSSIRQISLELTKVQLRQFIGQFKSLKTQLQ